MRIIRITSSHLPVGWERLWKTIKENQIALHSAHLAYIFLFCLFPLLIIFSYAIGRWEINSNTGALFLQNVLPSPIYSLVESYMKNARLVDTSQVFGASALSLYSCARIAVALRRKMRLIYGFGEDRGPFFDYVMAFMFSLLLLVGLLLSLFALFFGEELFKALEQRIPLNGPLVRLWLLARFGLIGLFIFVLIFVLYRYLPGIPLVCSQVVRGAFFSSVAWVLLSVLFSLYVDNLHDYSLIYGSVGVVMILLLWLYLSSFVLLMGVCINRLINEKK